MILNVWSLLLVLFFCSHLKWKSTKRISHQNISSEQFLAKVNHRRIKENFWICLPSKYPCLYLLALLAQKYLNIVFPTFKKKKKKMFLKKWKIILIYYLFIFRDIKLNDSCWKRSIWTARLRSQSSFEIK